MQPETSSAIPATTTIFDEPSVDSPAGEVRMSVLQNTWMEWTIDIDWSDANEPANAMGTVNPSLNPMIPCQWMQRSAISDQSARECSTNVEGRGLHHESDLD